MKSTRERFAEVAVVKRALVELEHKNMMPGGLSPWISFNSIVESDEVVQQGWTDSKVRRVVRDGVRIGAIVERKMARSKGYRAPRF